MGWGQACVSRELTKTIALHAPQSFDCVYYETPMASITIRNLDEKTEVRLRLRAANHKRSMEEEARNILRTALAEDRTTSGNLAEAIRRRFEPLGGVSLTLPAREAIREPPKPSK